MYDPTRYQDFKTDAINSFCPLEKVFLPSFSDLMTHLVVHLIDELDVYGPIHSRWMYFIERTMKDLKGYVRNMCEPKGCMVEGYVFDEALGLCT